MTSQKPYFTAGYQGGRLAGNIGPFPVFAASSAGGLNDHHHDRSTPIQEAVSNPNALVADVSAVLGQPVAGAQEEQSNCIRTSSLPPSANDATMARPGVAADKTQVPTACVSDSSRCSNSDAATNIQGCPLSPRRLGDAVFKVTSSFAAATGLSGYFAGDGLRHHSLIQCFSGESTASSAQSQLSPFDQKRCELYSKFAFQWWKVEALVHALSAMRAPPDFHVVRCPSGPHFEGLGGMGLRRSSGVAGYDAESHQIWLCGNQIWNPYEFRRQLAHQLVHAFDFARAEIDAQGVQLGDTAALTAAEGGSADWSRPAGKSDRVTGRGLDHIACTQIRAANLSGECDLWTQWWDYLGEPMINRKQRCIKDKTILAMRKSGDPYENWRRRASAVQRARGHDSVDDEALISDTIFAQCFNDSWPFTQKAHLDTGFRDSPRLLVEDQA